MTDNAPKISFLVNSKNANILNSVAFATEANLAGKKR